MKSVHRSWDVGFKKPKTIQMAGCKGGANVHSALFGAAYKNILCLRKKYKSEGTLVSWHSRCAVDSNTFLKLKKKISTGCLNLLQNISVI